MERIDAVKKTIDFINEIIHLDVEITDLNNLQKKIIERTNIPDQKMVDTLSELKTKINHLFARLILHNMKHFDNPDLENIDKNSEEFKKELTDVRVLWSRDADGHALKSEDGTVLNIANQNIARIFDIPPTLTDTQINVASMCYILRRAFSLRAKSATIMVHGKEIRAWSEFCNKYSEIILMA